MTDTMTMAQARQIPGPQLDYERHMERFWTIRREAIASPNPLGALVRSRRLELGLTQEQVTRRIGASAKYLSLIEQGVITRPGPQFAIPLSRVLGVPVARIWTASNAATAMREEARNGIAA